MIRCCKIVLLGIVLIGCGREKAGIIGSRILSLPEQKYLFEIEYINFAWGYMQHGLYIDSSGQVFDFQYSPTDTPWAYIGHPIVSEEQLQEKYAHQAQFRLSIPRSVLRQKAALIPLTLKAQYSDTTYPMVDAGLLIYKCYWKDESTGLYRVIELEVSGDSQYHNQSAAARELSRWLEDIRKKLERTN